MYKFTIMLGLILLTFGGYAQQDSTYVSEGPVGDAVDMSDRVIEIKLEPDRPRVTIFSSRIQPEFDTVDLEKSFMPELLGRGERIELVETNQKKPVTTMQSIDIDKVLNKPRNQ
jgi:hypothetical protein